MQFTLLLRFTSCDCLSEKCHPRLRPLDNEVGFGELTIMFVFRFDGGVFEFPLFTGDLFFLVLCILELSIFSSDVFFLSPLHFGVVSFSSKAFILAPCILSCPFFHRRFFLSLLYFEVTSFLLEAFC
jgi:hypothetical protein